MRFTVGCLKYITLVFHLCDNLKKVSQTPSCKLCPNELYDSQLLVVIPLPLLNVIKPFEPFFKFSCLL